MNEEKYDRLCIILEELYFTGNVKTRQADDLEWKRALENEKVTADEFDDYCWNKLDNLGE